MNAPDFSQTFVEAFDNWSFPPDELVAYQHLLSERKPYLICITPRSGSTYLTDLMIQTKSAGRIGEWLNLSVVNHHLRRLRSHGDSIETVLQYLFWVISKRSSGNRAVGIKTSFFQFQPLIHMGLDQTFFDRFQIIRLYRRDLVRQAVSLYLATETGFFHSHLPLQRERSAHLADIPYDAEKIRGWIQHIWVQELGWENYFRSRRQPAPRFFYEELDRTPRRVARRIMRFLDLDIGHMPSPHRSKVKKLGDSRNADWAHTFISDADNLAFMRQLGIPRDRFLTAESPDMASPAIVQELGDG